MKALLYKQMKLVAHPMTYVLILMAAMLLIPNYPYTVAFFYTTLGIFFMYMNAREQRDTDYTALLPVSKKDSVKAAFIFCTGIEIVSLIAAVPFAVISAKINPNGTNEAGLDANAALFGFGFLLYALFNLVFFTSFYKSGYKVGVSFVKACIPVAIVVTCDVVLSHIFPYLDGYDNVSQIPVLAGGIVVYAVLTFVSYRKSVRNYEKVDL